MTAPTAAISGKVSAITATTFTTYLDSFPASDIDGWRVAYRVKNATSPSAWSYSSTNSSVTAGATIQVTGLTEGTIYETAFQGLNGAEKGEFGTSRSVVPEGSTSGWDGYQIVSQIMSLIDDNLTASGKLGLARVTQDGRLDDYPRLRDQSGHLPWCLVELVDGSYQWRRFPGQYTLEYQIRVLHAWEYATTDDVNKSRIDRAGLLAGLFVDYPSLDFDGGITSHGTTLQARPTSVQLRPPEDNFSGHGQIAAVALTITVTSSVS